jgi:hypothetical protein
MSNVGILPGNDFVMQQTEGGEGDERLPAQKEGRLPQRQTASSVMGPDRSPVT